MHTLKNIGLCILKYIGTVIIAVVIVLSVLLGYFSLQIKLFGKGDYLLFISNNLNIIPALMIIILFGYFIMTFADKLINEIALNDEEIQYINSQENIENLSYKERILLKVLSKFVDFLDFIFKIFDIIKVFYIPVLLIAIYVGMTSYAILYPDSIKLGSPLHPSGVTCDYKDIKSINIGLNDEGDDSYYPYYEVILKDGKSIDFFGGSSMDESNKSFEEVLIDFDRKLRSQGITKSVNKDNFEKYAEGLDEEFTSRVEKLFVK